MDNVVKNEFLDYSGIPFCHACLSTDRTLSAVTEYADIYYKICDQVVDLADMPQLCWECLALLKKVKMFSKKVAEAQIMLQFCLSNKQNPFSCSLTNLRNCKVDTTSIHLTYEEKEIKSIKLEPDFDEHCNEFDFVYHNDVKDEVDQKPESTVHDFNVTNNEEPQINEKTYKTKEFISKIIEQRKAKYRFINTELKKHRRYLVRTIPVDINEVLPQLEAERSNAGFTQADYKCVGCVEIFNDEEGLKKHCKKYHEESLGPSICDICHSRFPTSADLLTHSSKHMVKRECRVCWVQSMAAGTMARHVRLHHRIVQCIHCELFFKNVRLFYNHYKALHVRCICDVCGKQRKSRELMEKHLRCHFGYKCPHCEKVLKNSSSFSNHVECQHGAGGFGDDAYCVPCDRRFKNVKLYKRHLLDSAAHARERENNRLKRKFPCPECSNVYSRKTYMNNHYRHVHSKQSKHYCEDCGRHFLNRTRFVDHRRFKHEGVRRDKDKLCNICGRGFAANRTLINHIRTHSGERPFGCDYCGAKFTQKHAMLSHVKFIHLKNKRKPSWHE